MTRSRSSSIISRGKYFFSLIVLFLNIACAVAALFIGNPVQWASNITDISSFFFPVFLFAGLFTGWLCDAFSNGLLCLARRYFNAFDHVLYVLKLLSIIGFGGCLGILLLSGGSPTIADGAYFIISHGMLVREIPKGYFLFLSYCQRWFFGSGACLFLTSHMALHARALYVCQSQK